MQRALVFALVLGLSPLALAGGADTLSVPLFSDEREQIWPIEIGMEIVEADTGVVVAEAEPMVVRDGQVTTLARVVDTPRGESTFEVELRVQHHAQEAIEIEYELVVREARFDGLTWSDYLMHRLALAPRPNVGPGTLAAARADIVECESGSHPEIVEVGGRRYEIRLLAQSLRG